MILTDNFYIEFFIGNSSISEKLLISPKQQRIKRLNSMQRKMGSWKLGISFLLVFLFIIYFAVYIFAQTLYTYNDTGCTQADDTFTWGETVYAGGSGYSTKYTYRLEYRDPTTLVCSNDGIVPDAGGNICDSGGCDTSGGAPDGWSVTAYRSGTGAKQAGPTYFTVLAPSEFPLPIGLLAVFLLCGFCYLFIKKKFIKQ